jgi:hypothetical protein
MYQAFTSLQQKRIAWLRELSQLESTDATAVAEPSQRMSFLVDKLQSTAPVYRQFLGPLYTMERDLYDQFYQTLKNRKLPSNACRDFRF